MKRSYFLEIAILGLLLAPTAAGQEQTIRRFALVVGANSGGPDREQLRFAATDARSFAAVMQQLGGVQGDDGSLLINPNRLALRAAFDDLGRRMAKARKRGQRVELVFYFSGHSDEVGLLLDTEKVPYREARATIDRLPADVRVAVLDSCASGAFPRLKGGKRRPPFLYDASSSVKGHAFLTSSSEDEAAQESDRIQASFFTHYLVSGLRGAADYSGDGRVTLNEAYRFAFDETLAQTESTRGGPQHPAYDIRLVGTGDLVMTDIRQTSATLSVDAEVQGRLYIRDPSGRLVAELFKTPGRVVELGLPPGVYHIVADQKGRLSRAVVSLHQDQVTRLGSGQLTAIQPEETVARGEAAAGVEAEVGGEVAAAATPAAQAQSPKKEGDAETKADAAAKAQPDTGIKRDWPEEKQPEKEYRTVPFAVALFPPADTNSEVEEKVVNNLAINFLLGRAARIEGAQIGILGINWADEEVRGIQATVAGNYAGGDVRGFQGSVGFNSSASLEGAQGSVGANLADGEVKGVQMTVVANVAEQLEGAQGSVVANLAERAEGAQMSVCANIAEQLEGAQMSVGANLAKGVNGAQLGVGANVAERLDGAQLSAGANIAKEVRGAQLGLVNVASGRVKGLQLGLFNYADDADASLALIGVTRQGGIRPTVWTSDVGLLHAGLRFDARYTYTFLSGGFFPFGDGRSGCFGVGFGVKARLTEEVWLDADIGSQMILMNKPFRGNPSLHQFRLLGRWQMRERLALFAGPTFNLLTHWDIDDNPDQAGRRPGYDYDVYSYDGGHLGVMLWPGFAAGMQF